MVLVKEFDSVVVELEEQMTICDAKCTDGRRTNKSASLREADLTGTVPGTEKLTVNGTVTSVGLES